MGCIVGAGVGSAVGLGSVVFGAEAECRVGGGVVPLAARLGEGVGAASTTSSCAPSQACARL